MVPAGAYDSDWNCACICNYHHCRTWYHLSHIVSVLISYIQPPTKSSWVILHTSFRVWETVKVRRMTLGIQRELQRSPPRVMIIRSPALLNPFQRATKASRCFNEWVGRLTLVWEPVVMVRCPHLTIGITRVCQFCRAASTNLCVFVCLYHSIGSELYQDAKRASTANFQIDKLTL